MAVGYRSIFSLRHGQDAVRLTAEQFRSWLALKGYGFVAVAPGVHEVAEHAHLVVTELHPHDGSRSLRYRLTEDSSAGEWVTTVTVHSDGVDDDWVLGRCQRAAVNARTAGITRAPRQGR